jgi:predicted ATP-binding protein involved in virulence
MLTALSIRDIVLIEKLDISLEEGLTVLTGETGAGKSILLDALGLYNIVPLCKQLDHLGNHLRWVLSISVQGDHKIPA